MTFVDTEQFIHAAFARGFATVGRCAETAQMHISNAVLVQRGSKLALGKTRTSRGCYRPHIDQDIDPRFGQFFQHRRGGGMLVTDCEKRDEGLRARWRRFLHVCPLLFQPLDQRRSGRRRAHFAFMDKVDKDVARRGLRGTFRIRKRQIVRMPARGPHTGTLCPCV